MDIQIPVIETPEELQRTEKWFEARRGRFTGSEIKKLMTCDRSAAKYEWGRPEKIISLGDTAIKYIYSKAKERQRNKTIHTAESSAMRYGKSQEEIVFEMIKEKYPNIEKVDFLEFIPGVAGASADGRGTEIGIEIKCPTSWDSVYDRYETVIDQSHDDFWQLQSEMLALGVNRMLYVVAEPSENIFEPNITDINEKWVMASPVHQEAIKQRCMLGDMIIKKYLSGVEFHEAVRQGCSEFEIK